MNIPFEKSFASHEKSKFWSDKNDKTPGEFCISSNKKCWFDCKTCNHTFESALSHVSRGRWCHFCSGHKICDDDNCIKCYNKSFLSHPKSRFWSDLNDKKPREVFKGTLSKYWFNCGDCGHSFHKSINNIGHHWCPYCGDQKICEKNDCKICLDKSFESHPKSEYWSLRNELKPRNVFKGTIRKYWFKCNKGHEFETVLNSISNGTWCPKCNYKTELKLYDIMILKYPSIITELKQEWCKKKKCLPFDFCIPEYKIIIELDGPQHFKQISNWSSPEEQFENDIFKEKCANENGYSIIRIIQEDVFNDNYDWCKELCEEIEHIKNVNKVSNIYLCKKNEYKHFINV